MKTTIKTIVGAIAIVFFFAAGQATAQTGQCFENEGLKTVQTVNLTTTGTKVAGSFTISTYDESEPDKTVDFTGTKAGTKLTVKFSGETPYELPPDTKTIVWTLSGTVLKIPVYGKDYTTNKYSSYTADFVKCDAE